MKNPYPPILLTVSALALLLWMLPVGAQSAAGIGDELLPLIQSVAAQQKLIDDNQASIDKSLVTIQENLRQAKIYINRAGGGKAAK